MISHLIGTVCDVSPDGVVVEVGGVGFAVQCTPETLAVLRPGERVRIATSLVVREDALTLYGFGSDDERVVFESLQTASGIGPRLALAMLAVHRPDALRQAVAVGDTDALTLVPGIGKKGAQRILLDLKDRLGAPGDGGARVADGSGPSARPAAPSTTGWRHSVQSGLVNLGWPAKEAERAVTAVAEDLAADGDAGEHPEGTGVDVPAALRAAMRKLSRP